MIAQLVLAHPDHLRRLGTALVVLVLTSVFYWMGLHGAWLVNLAPGLQYSIEASPALWSVIASFVVAALLAANGIAINRLSRFHQIITVWVELLVLLMWFFYSFDLSFSFIARKIGFLVSQGVLTTLYISAIAIVIATALALIGAIAKLSKSGIAFGLVTFYTSLFRGLPLLMQLYLIYLGLPQLGFVIGPIPAGIAALALCYGAYMTEVFRAGIESIPIGQHEAATALGLRPAQTMLLVILPQAMRVIIPPTGNQFIAMLKDSSLVSVVGVWELMYLARTQGQTEFRHIEMLITASMIYWLLSIGLEYAQSRVERHFGKSLKR